MDTAKAYWTKFKNHAQTYHERRQPMLNFQALTGVSSFTDIDGQAFEDTAPYAEPTALDALLEHL
jgi:hypothetical protein